MFAKQERSHPVQKNRNWKAKKTNVKEIQAALDPAKGFEIPGFVRWKPFNDLAARVMGFGIKPEHVKD